MRYNKIDLTKCVFGNLTVVKELTNRVRNHVTWECICKCGKVIPVVSSDLTGGKKISCGCNNGVDLTNKRFGQLTALHRIDKKVQRYIIWKCKCDCGNEKEYPTGGLLNGSIKSCGCLHHRIASKNPLWTGCGDISGKFWGTISQSARKRGIKLLISIQDAWKLFEQQKGYCALSGVPISFSDSTASLDRIDSMQDYTIANIQWVHKHVNKMKMEFPQEYFIDMCSKIVETRLK